MRSDKQIVYKKIRPYKYKLLNTYYLVFPDIMPIFTPVSLGGFFKISRLGLEVSEGYAWDGLSGPARDTKESFIGGLVHDVLYQAIREELIPPVLKWFADDLFYYLLKECDVNIIYANYLYRGVQIFGSGSCVPGSSIVSDQAFISPLPEISK